MDSRSDSNRTKEVKEGGASETENTLKMLVSTDNHLGVWETDPIRGNDSFDTFEEILQLALDEKVDLVLLGGDLFHLNKPSRRTLHRTISLLRKYCLGDGAIRFRVISDQTTNFGTNQGRVNYEDPNFAVQMPIFTIHGNHDDPTRNGANTALSAVDLMAACNLINYFGKADKVDDVEIAPVLLEKGTTKVAFYGLGNIRDERLNRSWTSNKVKFIVPEEGTDDWFNIFVLHQNRDYGRGKKNCIHEHMLPDFLDLVVWGHEHECIITPEWSSHEEFVILQPGSSVATSLCEGEGVTKHVGIVHVQGGRFKVDPIKLKTVRPLLFREIALVDYLDPMASDLQEEIQKCLSDHVDRLIAEHNESSNEDGAVESKADESSTKMLPLIRLRVDHTDFNQITIQNKRFGAQFVGRVANPDNIIKWRKRKGASKSKKNGKGAADDEPIEPVSLSSTAVEELIVKVLDEEENKMMILPEPKMNLALEHFVTKHENGAIGDQVMAELETVRKMLKREKGVGRKEEIIARVSGHSERARAQDAFEREQDEEAATAASKDHVERDENGANGTFSEDEDVLSTATRSNVPPKRSRASRKQASAAIESDADDEEGSILSMFKRSAAASSTKTTNVRRSTASGGGSRKKRRLEQSKRDDVVQVDTDDEDDEAYRPKSSTRRRKDSSALRPRVINSKSSTRKTAKTDAPSKKTTGRRRRRARGATLAGPEDPSPAKRTKKSTRPVIVDMTQDDDDDYVEDFTSALTHTGALSEKRTPARGRRTRRRRGR